MVVEDGREEQETDNAVGPIQAALLAFDAAQAKETSVPRLFYDNRNLTV